VAVGGKARSGLVFALVSSLAISGCYWLRYADLARTHAELIEDLSSATLASLEASSRPLEPGEIERLRYPLARAREFAEIARKRYPERASLLALDALVARYAEFIAAVERTRIEPPDLARLREGVSEIHARAADVRSALEREAAG
jgi:hypothetical protein